MALSKEADPSKRTQSGLRRGSLGAGTIAFFVIATVAPLAGVAGASPVVFASNGAAGPATFVLAGVLFAVFSVGYVAMSRLTSNAGGFVAYIARGLGIPTATAAAMIGIVGYVAIQCALWAQFSVFAESLIFNLVGVHIPAWIILSVVLIVTTLIVCRGVEVSLSVAGVILGLEMLVLVVLVVAVFVHDGVPVEAVSALAPSEVLSPGLGIAFLFAVAAFAGFEATVVFSEEARDPHRTIPRAIILSIAVIALTYALTTFVLSIAWGPDNAQAAAEADPTAFLLGPAATAVGGWHVVTTEILIVTSFIASLVGSMNMFARLVFSLGRAGVLPEWLGSTTRRNGTPARAILGIMTVVATVLTVFMIAGADLIMVTFSWLLALGTVALLTTLVMTSLAILVFFIRNRADRPGWWAGVIAPLIALIGFAIVGYLAVTNYDTLLGGQGGTAEWLLLILPVAAGVGIIVSRRARRSPNFAADLG